MARKIEDSAIYSHVKKLYDCLNMDDKNEALHDIISLMGEHHFWCSNQNEVFADRCADIICPPAEKPNGDACEC